MKYVLSYHQSQLLKRLLNRRENSSTVSNCRTRFNELQYRSGLAELKDVTNTRFLNYLRSDLKHQVLVLNPDLLEDAFHKALEHKRYFRSSYLMRGHPTLPDPCLSRPPLIGAPSSSPTSPRLYESLSSDYMALLSSVSFREAIRQPTGSQKMDMYYDTFCKIPSYSLARCFKENPNRPMCTYCPFPGHKVDKCFKLYGYPIKYKFDGKNRTIVNNVPAASTSVQELVKDKP